MKRAFKLLSTTFLVFLTTMALANDEFDFRINTYGNKSIVLHIKNTEESVIQLTLKNSEGRSVFNESLAVCEQNGEPGAQSAGSQGDG